MTEFGIWLLALTVWGLSALRIKEYELQVKELEELTSLEWFELEEKKYEMEGKQSDYYMQLWEILRTFGGLISVVYFFRFIYLLAF
jgi:hypothetical protein